MEYRVKRSNDYLMHHGIKGQKWGVKNGPPYPLKENAHTTAETAEKKAGMAELIVPALYLSAMAATLVIAKKAAKKADERRTQQFEEEYYNKREIKTLEECPKIDPKSMTMDEHMKAINPDYPEFGSTQNCMFCTTAMAMRMKGYDVSAETCPDGWTTNNLAKTWENMEVETPKLRTASALEDYIAKQGDGAYGNIMVYSPYGGGHSMFYQVDNGEIKIYDTQANKTRKLRDFSGVVDMAMTDVARLDNKEPTEYALGCVKKRKET